MRLLQRDLKPVSLIKSDGSRYDDIRANLQSNVGKMLTQAMKIPFEEGDIIERTLPNGITEQYKIVQINYSSDFMNMDINKIVKKKEVVNTVTVGDKSILKEKIQELIKEADAIVKEELHKPERGMVFPEYISGPRYEKWMSDVYIISQRELLEHPLHEELGKLAQKRNQMESSINKIVGILKSVLTDEVFWAKSNNEQGILGMSKKVFIVHGHDETAKITVARVLEKAGFEPIILHEQANLGKTIIEKLDYYTDVDFAIVLYTECDLGRAKEETVDKERYRARQNVVYEHGYLIGKIGREKVFALVKGDVETPGDISGVVYTPMDGAGAWKMDLARDMKAVGLPIDMNDLI